MVGHRFLRARRRLQRTGEDETIRVQALSPHQAETELEEKAEDEEEFVEEEESQFDLITDRRIAEGLRQVDHVKEFEARKGENGISLEVVTICGADEAREEVPKHLACKASPVLGAMFGQQSSLRKGWKETENNAVEFREIERSAIRALAEYIRTGSCKINGSTAIALLDATNTLLIMPLYFAVLEWIEKKLAPPNALTLYQVGRLYNFDKLKVKAWEMLGLYDFTGIFAESPAWEELDIGTLKSCLKSRKMLTVCCENAILLALERWCMVDEQQRRHAYEGLLCDADAVQLGHVSPGVWNERAGSEHVSRRVAETVLHLQKLSRAFSPAWRPITAICFDSGFTECLNCQSVSYLTYLAEPPAKEGEDPVAQEPEAYCENCIRVKTSKFVTTFPMNTKAKRTGSLLNLFQSRPRGATVSGSKPKSLWPSKLKPKRRLDEEEDVVSLVVTPVYDESQARRYTWPDLLDSSSIVHPAVQALRTCKLRSGAYEVKCFLGGNIMESSSLQLYVSTHSEVSGNGKDELGNFVIEGAALGANISLTKAYKNARVALDLSFSAAQKQDCIFTGTWELTTTERSSQDDRQRRGFFWMKWKSLEQDFKPSASSDMLPSLLSASEGTKKSFHFDPAVSPYNCLELKVYGGQPATLCPQQHPLSPITLTNDEGAKPPPSVCSVCNKKRVVEQKNQRAQSSSSSLEPAVPPPPPRRQQSREEKEEEPGGKESEQEIAEDVSAGRQEEWFSCPERDCGFYACGECMEAAKQRGHFPAEVTAPICVQHHALAGPVEGEDGLEVTCHGCVKSIEAQTAHECETCSTSANVHYYCEECVQAVKVTGRMLMADGSEESVTGVLWKHSDSLFVVGDKGLKMQIYAVQVDYQEDLFACVFKPDAVAIHAISKVTQFGAENEQTLLQIPKPKAKQVKAEDTAKASGKEAKENLFHACTICAHFRKDLSVENAIDVLLAAIRDEAQELEAFAEQFIVSNYAAISQRHTGDVPVFAQIAHASLPAATRIADRLLRSPEMKRQFIGDMERLLAALAKELEERPSAVALCMLGEMCALSMSSLRFEMLWMSMDDKVTAQVSAGLLKALSVPMAKEDTVFASLAASVVGSMANQLLAGSESWPAFDEKVVIPLLDGAEAGLEDDLRLQCLRWVSKSAFASDNSTAEKLERVYLEQIGGDSGSDDVRVRAVMVLHERLKTAELEEEFLDEVVSAVCHVVKGSESVALQMETLKLLYSCVNWEIEPSSRKVELSAAAKDRIFDAVVGMIKAPASPEGLKKEAISFWNGLGDHEQIRLFFQHGPAERSKVAVLSAVLLDVLVGEVEAVSTMDSFVFTGSVIELVLSLLNELVFCFDNDFFPWSDFEPTAKRVLKSHFQHPADSWKDHWLRHSLFGAFYPLLLYMEREAPTAIFNFIGLSGQILDDTASQVAARVEAFGKHRIDQEIPDSELEAPPVEEDAELDGEADENALMQLEEKRQRKATRVRKTEEDCARLKDSLLATWTDFFLFNDLLVDEDGMERQGGISVRRASLWALGRVFLWKNACALGLAGSNVINMSAISFLKHSVLATVHHETYEIASTGTATAIRLGDSFDIDLLSKEVCEEQGVQWREELIDALIERVKKALLRHTSAGAGAGAFVFAALSRLSLRGISEATTSGLLGIIQHTVLMEDSVVKFEVQSAIMQALMESEAESAITTNAGSLRTLELAIQVCKQAQVMFQEYTISFEREEEHQAAVIRSTVVEQQNDAILKALRLILFLVQRNTLFVWTQKEKVLPILLPSLSRSEVQPSRDHLPDNANLSMISARILSYACAHTSPDWLSRSSGVLMSTVLYTLAKRDHERRVDAALIYLIGDLIANVPALAAPYLEEVVVLLKHLAMPEYVQLCMRSGLRNPHTLRAHRDVVKRAILTTCASIMNAFAMPAENAFNLHVPWLIDVIDSIIKEQEIPGNYWDLEQELETIDEDSEAGDVSDETKVGAQEKRTTGLEAFKPEKKHRKSSLVTVGSMFSSPDDVVFLRGANRVDVRLLETVVYLMQIVQEKCEMGESEARFQKLRENTSALRRYVEKYGERAEEGSGGREAQRKSRVSFDTENDLNEEYDLDAVLDRGNNPFFQQFPFRLRRG